MYEQAYINNKLADVDCLNEHTTADVEHWLRQFMSPFALTFNTTTEQRKVEAERVALKEGYKVFTKTVAQLVRTPKGSMRGPIVSINLPMSCKKSNHRAIRNLHGIACVNHLVIPSPNLS